MKAINHTARFDAGQRVNVRANSAASGNTLPGQRINYLPEQELPPHDTKAEAGALGSILISDNGDGHTCLAKLTLDHFHDLRHQTVYRAMTCVALDGKEPNLVNVAQWLSDKRQMDDAGGFDYVQRLPDESPSPENFSSFFETLNDRMERRRVITDTSEVNLLARDTAKPLSVVSDAFRKVIEAHATAATETDVTSLLQDRAFDATIEPPALRPIFTLAGTPISTPGNVTTITAAIKAGKSAVIGAMAAAAMPHTSDADVLGFGSSNPQQYGLVWFDSEQSHDDFWNGAHRAMRRAGLSSPPNWLLPYWLTGIDPKRTLECLMEATENAKEQHGGVHSILIDGVADLVNDVNDAGECNDLVARLHALAGQYDCSIIGVIHLNPGTEKSRGHLGSQLERKAESNLVLEKDNEDESTVIYSTKNRRAGIPKNTGPRFKYSKEAAMHVTIESRQSAKDAANRQDLLATAQDVFGERPSIRYSDLKVGIMETLRVSEPTSKRKIAAMVTLGVIKQSLVGLYVLGN